ncbi:hypothetical protein [Kribbella sp. CA-293567]|nr:hypothetical protein [Kribbella sp. CA-293567]WBQ08544.1 hypothetical protein OX958_17420 [Kribbella sp. CA-293567]
MYRTYSPSYCLQYDAGSLAGRDSCQSSDHQLPVVDRAGAVRVR